MLKKIHYSVKIMRFPFRTLNNFMIAKHRHVEQRGFPSEENKNKDKMRTTGKNGLARGKMKILSVLALILIQACAMSKSSTYTYSDTDKKQYRIKMRNGHILDTLIIMDANNNIYRKKVLLGNGTYLDTNYESKNAIFDSCTKASKEENGPRSTETILRVVKDSLCNIQKYCSVVKVRGQKKKVLLNLEIEPSGKIGLIVLEKETIGDPILVQNIIEDISKWNFGISKSCKSDIVTIPFLFGY